MLSFFPRGVLDEILNLIESVSKDFPSYSCLLLVVILSNLSDWPSGGKLKKRYFKSRKKVFLSFLEQR